MRLLVLPLVLVSSSLLAAPAGFWSHWGDGRAEVNGYRLVQQRYGQERVGQAVAVFVTEDFTETFRVKADPGKHRKADVYPVMKLNLVESFQTGVYDYNVMTSVWARVEPGHGMDAFAPVKMTFGAQEWCGQVFEGWWFRPDGTVRYDRHSYFDGEADDSDVIPAASFADTLLLRVRGFGAPLPPPGGSVALQYVPRLKSLRLLHQEVNLVAGTLTRGKSPEKVRVPAGEFTVERFTVTTGTTPALVVLVEEAAPRRIIAWEVPGQERAELTGSIRDPYWQHNRNGDEAILEKLGLKPLPAR